MKKDNLDWLCDHFMSLQLRWDKIVHHDLMISHRGLTLVNYS